MDQARDSISSYKPYFRTFVSRNVDKCFCGVQGFLSIQVLNDCEYLNIMCLN